MPPFHAAQAVYEREPCARPFYEDLHHHLEHGHVISSPALFAMARTVYHDWPHEWLRQPWRTAPDGDCWMVWLVAGDLSEAFARQPFPLPWLAYERGNVMRVVRMRTQGLR